MIEIDARNKRLQELCRQYLKQLESIAEKFGLGDFVHNLICENKAERCEATEEEVKLLSRAIDDERVSRVDVPKILGKSYRKCVEDEDFEKVETLKRVGIYSKVSAEIYNAELKKRMLKFEY